LRKISFILLIAALALHSFGQGAGYALLNGEDFLKLKFRPVHGFLVLDVYYGGLIPLHFIFDTGAQNTIFFSKETAEMLPIQYDRVVQLVGADLNDDIKAYIARRVYLKIGDSPIVEKDIVVLESDRMKLQEAIGENIHGIIGSDFIKGLIVEINYQNNEIILFSNNKFNHKRLKGFDSIGADFIQGKIFLDSYMLNEERDTVDLKLLLDSGAGISTLFHNNTSEKIKIPAHYISGNLGKGISGDVTGLIGRIKELGINKFKFPNLIGYYQNFDRRFYDTLKFASRNGLIGNIILSRFTVIIDYVKEEVYLKPNRDYNKKIEYDKSGLVLLAQGPKLDQIIVHEVLPNTPAELAGIRPGDRVSSLHWYRYRISNLDYISKQLSRKINTKIKIRCVREGKPFTTHIILKELV
jgi:hypothetical protein